MPTTTDTVAAGELNSLELTPEMLDEKPPVEDAGPPEVVSEAVPEVKKIKLQNLMDNEQFVYVDGKKWALAPFQIGYLPEKVASAFQKERGQFVRSYAREPGYIEQGEPIVWIANMTGNPFLPDKIEREVVRKGKVEFETIDNPLSRPRHQRWSLHVGQKVVQVETSDGLEKKALNFPPRQFELAPFERKPFALKYAQRALDRDSYSEKHEQGKLMACREPQPGEPNGTWSYMELRLYAELMDKATFLPMLTTEGTGKDKKLAKFPAIDEVKGGMKLNHQEELKAELLTYLFFRLIDSRFPLVPYEVFEMERHNRGIAPSL